MNTELKQLIESYPAGYSPKEVVRVIFAETGSVVSEPVVKEIREIALNQWMHDNGIGA